MSEPRSRTRSWASRAGALALAGLALAACSSSEGPSPTTAAASTAAGTVAPTPAPSTAPASSAATTAAPTTAASTTAAPTTAAPTTAPATAAPTTDVPSGDAFYLPPDPLPDVPPGTLLRARAFPAGADRQAWQVLYTSRDAAGQPVAVSGVVYAPPGSAPSTPRPVLSWANGTVGLADQCAESKAAVSGGTTQAASLATLALAQGLVVAATDYQGLGTPGVHPYLVGAVEGHDVLDIVRAARQLPGTGVTTESPVLIWGHSQGGHSAAFAGELAPTYAPDLAVKGAVLGSPPGDLPELLSVPITSVSPYVGLGMLVLAGFQAAYPQLDLSPLLTPAGQQALELAKTQCVDKVVAALMKSRPTDLFKEQPTADPALLTLFQQNSPGRATSVPLFVYHGDKDNVVDPKSSQLMQARYCAAGATSERKVYPGADHGSVVPAALGDIVVWLQDRLAGKPAPRTC